jgi:glycogen debranching enzyme
MDNTPRGDFGIEIFDNDDAYHQILFVDALAQQALAAKVIFDMTGEDSFKSKHAELCDLLNTYYWDDDDGLYYDIEAEAPHRRVKVKTPASFWPLLAGACNAEQAAKLARNAADPAVFAGEFPFPSVSRDSVHYEPNGRYWRGGIWLPTAYMAVKALERNGHRELANDLAEKIVRQQYLTWRDFSPHTIWEAYSPSEPLPSNGKFDPTELVRPDFCGWSALGPICLMIENVLGIHVDGVNRAIDWNLHHDSPHGIRNLRLADITVDLSYANGTVHVKTDKPFKLTIGAQSQECAPGETSIPL